jgi:hypothetical protein
MAEGPSMVGVVTSTSRSASDKARGQGALPARSDNIQIHAAPPARPAAIRIKKAAPYL